MAAQSPEKEIGGMIAQAKDLSQAIIRQREAIAADIKLGRSSAANIQKLNSMIAQANEIAVRISAAQDTLISMKVSAQKQAGNTRGGEKRTGEERQQIPMPSLGKPAKVQSAPTAEVIKNAVYSQPAQEQKMEKRTNSFTASQIEAAGVPSDYLTDHKTGKAQENRQKCIWHPWRDAYTTCKFCGRPFCYEDIIDKNGTAFCLEDIDKTEKPVETKSARYQYGGMMSASVLMLILILFIYFGYPQIIYQGGKLFLALPGVLHGNFSELGQFENFVNLFPLLGLLIALFDFASGVAVLASTRKSFVYGVSADMISIIAFSYAYLAYIRNYMLIITILSFVSLVLLVVYKEYEYGATEKSDITDYLGADLSNLTAY